MQHPTPSAPAAPDSRHADWRIAIHEEKRRPLRLWLWSIAAMTLAVLIVGGVTRLTQSGLSIVDWQPIMGVIPPLTDAQWQARFDLYRQYPEYQLLRRGMSLEEFKFIFFWEYLHRLVARMIGVVFLVPFLFFAARGYFNRQLATRALVLFALGAAQGVLGWIMVSSGLVDRPSVSHYRLAAHLGLAFVIFGYAVWLARELRINATNHTTDDAARRAVMHGLGWVGALLALQVVWGAFVAGLRAGKMYNTFPLMGGRLVPREFTALDPAWYNFFGNPVTVQWTHRLLGTLLTAATVWLYITVRRSAADARSRNYALALLALMAVQYALGIATLLYAVPVSLGVIHQAAAMVIFGVWVSWLHHVRPTRISFVPETT
jgi:heme a synthase